MSKCYHNTATDIMILPGILLSAKHVTFMCCFIFVSFSLANMYLENNIII